LFSAREGNKKVSKILLLALGGRVDRIRAELNKRYPQAMIEEIERGDFERAGTLRCFLALRAKGPDIFAVATERVAWQRGQTLLMLFGALAGAREAIIPDAYGAVRRERRARILVTAPGRLAQEAILSLAVIVRARRNLRRLERTIDKGV
jgi:hypothetical protein